MSLLRVTSAVSRSNFLLFFGFCFLWVFGVLLFLWVFWVLFSLGFWGFAFSLGFVLPLRASERFAESDTRASIHDSRLRIREDLKRATCLSGFCAVVVNRAGRTEFSRV